LLTAAGPRRFVTAKRTVQTNASESRLDHQRFEQLEKRVVELEAAMRGLLEDSNKSAGDIAVQCKHGVLRFQCDICITEPDHCACKPPCFVIKSSDGVAIVKWSPECNLPSKSEQKSLGTNYSMESYELMNLHECRILCTHRRTIGGCSSCLPLQVGCLFEGICISSALRMLESMDVKAASEILQKMDAKKAAAVLVRYGDLGAASDVLVQMDGVAVLAQMMLLELEEIADSLLDMLYDKLGDDLFYLFEKRVKKEKTR
jgi:hypothetical protein